MGREFRSPGVVGVNQLELEHDLGLDIRAL
jgi:hypothetical protein